MHVEATEGGGRTAQANVRVKTESISKIQQLVWNTYFSCNCTATTAYYSSVKPTSPPARFKQCGWRDNEQQKQDNNKPTTRDQVVYN